MFKLWVKLFNDKNVMTKNELFSFDEEFDKENLFNYMTEICSKWGIETPIILSKHRNNLKEFNSTKFMKDDFVDYIDFHKLVVEYVE